MFHLPVWIRKWTLSWAKKNINSNSNISEVCNISYIYIYGCYTMYVREEFIRYVNILIKLHKIMTADNCI